MVGLCIIFCSLGRLAIEWHRRRGRCVGRFAGFDLAHRGAISLAPIGVVDNTIQDGVAKSWLANAGW